MEKLGAKLWPDSPVGRRNWSIEDMYGSVEDMHDCLDLPRYMVEKLCPHITSLGSMVPLLRQIYWCIVSEERRKGVSQEIKHLKENISGLPITVTEIESWIVAQKTEDMDVLRKLLDKQFKEVCLAFLRLSQNSDANMFLRNMLATFEGPWAKCASDVHGIIYKIIRHLQGKREMISEVSEWTWDDIMSMEVEEISEDEFLSKIKVGPVKIQYSPNREFLKLKLIPHFGWLVYTRVEWHTSVRDNKLVQLLLFEDWSVMEGTGDCLLTLQPQEVKDVVCYVSRTSGGIPPVYTSVRHNKLVQLLLFEAWSVMEGAGDRLLTLQPQEVKDAVCYVSRTGGGIPPVRRVRHGLDTFKRRQCIVTTGSSDTPYYIARSGRIVASKRGIGLWTGTPCYIINRGFRLLAATRRRRAPLWIYDTGSSISLTGKRRLLRGVHNAPVIYPAVVNGTTMASSYCGRISGAVNLSGVRYFPGAKVNLISGGTLADLGCEIIMNAKGCKVMKDGQVIGVGRRLPNNTFSLDFLDDKLLHGDCPYCQH